MAPREEEQEKQRHEEDCQETTTTHEWLGGLSWLRPFGIVLFAEDASHFGFSRLQCNTSWGCAVHAPAEHGPARAGDGDEVHVRREQKLRERLRIRVVARRLRVRAEQDLHLRGAVALQES